MNRQRVGLRSPRMVAAVMLVLLVLFNVNDAPVCAAQEDDVAVGGDASSSWDDHEEELDSNEDGPGFDLKAPMKMPDDTLMHFIEGADGKIYGWEPSLSEYVEHDEGTNVDGHHHHTVFDFDSNSPPAELQKDAHGHELPMIYNKRDKTRWVWHERHAEADSEQGHHLVYRPFFGPYMDELLFDAAKTGNATLALDYLANARPNVTARDELGNTPMHYAVGGGWEPLIRVLATHHGDLEALNNEGKKPFDVLMDNMDGENGSILSFLLEDIILMHYQYSELADEPDYEPGAKQYFFREGQYRAGETVPELDAAAQKLWKERLSQQN